MFLTCCDGCHEKTLFKDLCDVHQTSAKRIMHRHKQRRLTDDRQAESTAIPSIVGLKAVNTQNRRVAIHAAKHPHLTSEQPT